MSRPPTFTVSWDTLTGCWAEAELVSRSRTGDGPEELALAFGDGDIVDAGFAASHHAAFVKLPQLIAVATVPASSVVVPLVLEAHADPVVGKGPEGLDEPVVEFTSPLVGQEGANLGAADKEFTPVAPDRVFRVGQGHTIWIAGVPGVLGESHFLRGRLERERRG